MLPSSVASSFFDRDATTPGVRVINTLTDTESTSSPIATGMPPFDLAIVRPVEIGVADTAGLDPFPERVTWAQPNPFGIGAAGTEIFFRIDPGTRGDVSVYDIRGRVVRELRGEGSVVWDGRDRSGRDASPGIYFYRVKSGGDTATGRITLLK